MNPINLTIQTKNENLKNIAFQLNNKPTENQIPIRKSRTLTYTSIKDFILKQEFPSVNKYLKLYKATRKMDHKEYILGIYPLKLITNNYLSKKLEEITDIMKTLLIKINCIHVINIKESFIDESKDDIIIVLDLFQNKTLYTEIINKYKKMNEKYIPELILLDYLKQIVKGLMILHDNNIYNINLDPQNIYYSEEIEKNNNNENNILLKLNPYSSLENLSCSRKCNNKYFNLPAPELLKDEKIYTTKTDIWYLGLLIYELSQLKTINNNIENTTNEKDDIYNLIIKGTYSFNNYYYNNFKELIKLCLQYSAKRRASARELLSLIDIYKNNYLGNKRITDFNIIRKKINICKSKVALKEELEKYNHTLSKIQQYEKRKKSIFRNLTPINKRKNFQTINPLNLINRNFLKRIKMKGNFVKRQKLRLKKDYRNENENNKLKTGKKFFQIRKNNETFQGYMKIPDKTKFYNYDDEIKYLKSKTPNNLVKTDSLVESNYITKLFHPKKLTIFDVNKYKQNNYFKKTRKFQRYKTPNHKNLIYDNVCNPKILYKEIKIVSYKKANRPISNINIRAQRVNFSNPVNLVNNKTQTELKSIKMNNDIFDTRVTIDKKLF